MARRVRGIGESRRGKYPWDEWLDGSAWEMKYQTDFSTSPVEFTRTARRAAKARGLRVHAVVVGDGAVRLQAEPVKGV